MLQQRSVVLLTLCLLCVVVVVVKSSEVVTIDASGEIISSSDNDCVPKDLLNNGHLKTCTTYEIEIATLNASPRRCIHIESISEPIDEEEKPTICTNWHNWHDGTNGCHAYEQNQDWCELYGGLDYSGKSVPHNANVACCICGGGTLSKQRLFIGDRVKVSGYGAYDSCELKINKVNLSPSLYYVVEVIKECGAQMIRQNEHGVMEMRRQIQPKMTLQIDSDDPKRIVKDWRVELKKCNGLPAQEFVFIPTDKNGFIIQHKFSGISLAEAMGATTSKEISIKRVFEDDAFLGSEEYYYLEIINNIYQGRVVDKILTSGNFGEKEYSIVKSLSKSASSSMVELQYSMWQFRPVAKEVELDEKSTVLDEHAAWLLRMTQRIGIDYLDKLPPFHLLDVDREASKSEVKARFRELSKNFHPDKLINQPEKKDLFERIFVLLQNAYQGLKNSNEAEKERFRVQAESASQIFAHSLHIIELLPHHWTKIDDGVLPTDGTEAGEREQQKGRYILNVASQINSTLLEEDLEESDITEQIWVTFMYSARCSMSRAVVGVVDLAARHLAELGIKVGAYGCGLYQGELPPHDPTGVTTDPICAQFERRETPNVHVIVETLPGRKKDAETGEVIVVHPDQELVKENAMFKYFYSSVPDGNSTLFLPHSFIDFAKAGRRAWQSSHLVHKMRTEDFSSVDFISNISIVAFLDGTGLGETNAEIVNTITSSFPGVARRFVNDDVYVGIANCGFGDEYDDENDQRNVDCSKLDVSWLPDVKVYGHNEAQGESLLRGNFGDRRDVQIALESMGNVIRMLVGGEDGEDDESKIDDMKEETPDEGNNNCGNAQQPPAPDLDLDEIEGTEEAEPKLLFEMNVEEVPEEVPVLDKVPKKPKLASPDKTEKIIGGRDNTGKDRVAGFESRPQKHRGGGRILGGGGGSGGGGFIGG